ncbi:hypothetical protein BDV06DRAFT_201797, partial [Aspergillus oleicola]
MHGLIHSVLETCLPPAKRHPWRKRGFHWLMALVWCVTGKKICDSASKSVKNAHHRAPGISTDRHQQPRFAPHQFIRQSSVAFFFF